jgi:hypothetical protein
MTRFTPGVASFYRGKTGHSSALQLKLIPPSSEREGYVIIDMTSGPNPFQYNWKDKLSFKLSYTELAAIANYQGKPLKFQHDPNATRAGAGTVTKTLELKPGSHGGAFIDLATYQGGTKERAHAIALSDHDLYAIRQLCRRALTITIGWDPAYLVPPASLTTASSAQGASPTAPQARTSASRSASPSPSPASPRPSPSPRPSHPPTQTRPSRPSRPLL